LVIFQPGHDWPGAPWWWRIAKRYMQPGFGHVMVCFYDPDGDAWCIIDPVYGGIQARAIACGGRLLTGRILADYPGTAWAVIRRDRAVCPPLVRGPLTCVSVVKAVLGLGGRSWTPWQLHQQIEGMRREEAESAEATEAAG
jgi:hypothetical protein